MASMIKIDGEKVAGAIMRIGSNDSLREQFISLCREAETQLKTDGINIREEVTGPLVDALMKDQIFQKPLTDGTLFEMRYVAKISRDFILSPDPIPDHLWEPQTTKLLLHLSANAKTVVIGGAYVGDQAILIAKKISTQHGTCHVFEPNEHSFHFLRRNAELNHLTNLHFNNSGLWHKSAFIRLVGDDSHAYPEEVTDSSDRIRAVSINDYGKENHLDKIDLIMLDTEGGEFAALNGADDYLKQPMATAPNIVFEIHRHYIDWSQGLEETEIVKYLKSFGYHIYAVRDFQSNYPMKGKPVELIPLSTVYLEGPPHGFNMLAIKNEKIISDPLFKIVEGVSPKLLLHKDPRLHHPVDGL